MNEWMKLLLTFPRNPRLREIMRGLKTKDKDSAIGFAVRWLIFVQEQTTDGCTGLLPDELDDELGRKNATASLLKCGWAYKNEEGCVCAAEFEKHCGETAKKRAVECRKKALQRGQVSPQKRDKCPVESGTDFPKKAGAEKEIEYNSNKGGSISNSTMAAAAETPAPRPMFPNTADERAWMAAVAAAHPTLNPDRPMADDVRTAAEAAFKRFPEAEQHAELLAAFMRAKPDYIGEKERFYRPVGQRQFFAALEDALAHAQRWARFHGWKPRAEKKKPTPEPQGLPGYAPQSARPLTEEEMAVMFAEMRGGKR